MMGATPNSSSSSIFSFSSRLLKSANKPIIFSRSFSFENARKTAAMCGLSSEIHFVMKFFMLRNVDIGHFCSKIIALTIFWSSWKLCTLVPCRSGSLMTYSHASFRLLKCRKFVCVDRTSTRIDTCAICEEIGKKSYN